jgi:cell division protein FtsW (lipid II flippase)
MTDVDDLAIRIAGFVHGASAYEETRYFFDRFLLPIGLVVLGMVALILPEPDFGTSMAILMITAVMIFAAGLNWRYLAGLALVGLPAIYLVVIAGISLSAVPLMILTNVGQN